VGLLAVLVAGGALAAPGDATPPRMKDPDWPTGQAWVTSHILHDDWLLVGGADAQYWFVSSLPTDAPDYPILRDWVRAEIARDGAFSKSMLLYIEVDCDKKRYRTLEYYHYLYNNLRGSFYTGEESADKWIDVRQGSNAQAFTQSICRGAR